MKYRDPETGEFKELYTKAADTLPVGTEVDYDGDEVPAGWAKVDNNYYSTEETFTGKYWTDGKKIYRKVINLGGFDDTLTTNMFTLNGNYESVIPNTMFYLSNPSNGGVVTIPANLGNDINITASATSNKQGVIEITATRGKTGIWTDWVLNCVLEYTKITD